MSEGDGNIRILLADDHVLIRHGIKNIISQNKRFDIVGEVGSGDELFDFLKNVEVHIVILDISMPGIAGMEAIKLVRKNYPHIKILILTMHESKQVFYSAMSAGADGYLMKNDPDNELLVALEKVARGKKYVSPNMTEDFASDMILMFQNDGKSPTGELTRREKQILQLVVKGLTSRKMAEKLKLSQRTVDHYRSNLLRKFNRKNSVDLVNYVIRNGYVIFDE
ncbi:response regulator [Desulforhopalus singaporensis]|uniref:Two component transcriptional regulator, LuxR family n=1 Tax=Desulforhopalus singaporensis TaxID=91360 RepID=A0A1H0JNH3_9BACT|nr:response regulator transcription factor [Desulforhopalus singaporensis]SDO45298.1 two component transcriptional regulator, LuxR family [Desulforhopalus singaporensis]